MSGPAAGSAPAAGTAAAAAGAAPAPSSEPLKLGSLTEVWKQRAEWNRFVAYLDAVEGEGEDSDGRKMALGRYARYVYSYRVAGRSVTISVGEQCCQMVSKGTKSVPLESQGEENSLVRENRNSYSENLTFKTHFRFLELYVRLDQAERVEAKPEEEVRLGLIVPLSHISTYL